MVAVVKIVGDVEGDGRHDGRWVKSWTPHVPFGTLAVESTDDVGQAQRFVDKVTAWTEWRTVSAVEPVRPTDGAPNKPLTALSILIEDEP